MSRRAVAALGLGGLGLSFAGGVLLGRKRGIPFVGWRREYAIAVYQGPDPLHLAPAPGARPPALTAADVTDVPAAFVADPFLLQRGGAWSMFFEVLNRASGRGELGLASSPDGRRWQYQGIVLREPFHLSYPFVFEWQDQVYLLPESTRGFSLRLYRPEDYPRRWTLAKELLVGEFHDPTLLVHAGRCWLFAAGRDDLLRLYLADDPLGPWIEHPRSPIVRDNPRLARPAGRIVAHQGRLLRFAQDCAAYYGQRVRALQIDALTPDVYAEHELSVSPLLGPSGRGWNARGMHHLDAHQLPDGSWLAAVDGFRRRPEVGLGR